jgi:hypothetical protein
VNAAAAVSAPPTAAPAATIITAKFDVNAVGPSARTRKLSEAAGQLDEYLEGLAQASTALAVQQGLISPQGQPQQQQQQQQQEASGNGKQRQQQQAAAKELAVAAAAGATGLKAATPAKAPAAARASSSSSSSRAATLSPGHQQQQQQQQRPARLPEFSLEAPPDALPVPT